MTEQAGSSGSESNVHKRKRAAYSCTECTKGKAKCDRQLPCGRCVSRRVPHLCHYLVNGYEDPIDLNNEIRERLSRIETLLLERQPILVTPPNPIPTNDNPHHRAGFIARGRYYGPSAMSHVGDGSATDLMKALNVPDPETPVTDEGSADRRPPRTVVDLVQDLPSRALCDELVRLYFDGINLTRYPIRRDRFETFYDSLWAIIGSFNLEPSHIHRLPLLFIILAISTLTASPSVLRIDPLLPKAVIADKKIQRANEFFGASRRAAAYIDGLLSGRGDIMLVMSDLLTVRYLILVRRAPDAQPLLGSTIARAQACGLHRNSLVFGETELEDDQERRSIWSYVYHMDRYCSLLLGRPLAISDRSFDAEPPMNLDRFGTVVPPDQVTLNSFLIYRDKLARIMGQISNEVFALDDPPYEAVGRIENALQAWSRLLPPQLALSPLAGDAASPLMVAIHRHLIFTEYNFARISLHRPYLVRPDPSGRFARSRDACLDAAIDDLTIRTASRVPGMENLSTGSYRIANSIIILGLTLLLNPSTTIVHRIQHCLSQFSAARRDNTELLDEAKIKEAAMIELVQMKAGHLTRNNSRAASPGPLSENPALESSTYGLFDQYFSLDGVDLFPRGTFANPGEAEVDWAQLTQLLGGDSGAPSRPDELEGFDGL